MNLVNFSKTLSYALRHRPEKFGITLDSEGWVGINELLKAIGKDSPKYKDATLEDIKEGLRKADKKRFEIDEDKNRIRAYYGHSVKDKIQKKKVVPPIILYHGTTKEALPKIMKGGLKPMNRQYVHLSTDEKTASRVGVRRTKDPIILTVSALQAHDDGINFYLGNQDVWLSGPIPSKYLSRPKEL